MTILLSVLGLLAVAALTFGTAVAVASEFSLTALERRQVYAHVAEVGDMRSKMLQRAHRNLSFQLSGSQLLITVTTLASRTPLTSAAVEVRAGWVPSAARTAR